MKTEMGNLVSVNGRKIAVGVLVAVLVYLRLRKLRQMKQLKNGGNEATTFLSMGRKNRPELPAEVGKVSQLNIFPVKSCKGVPVDSSNVDRNGLDLDRKIMFVNKSNVPVTQRMNPELALIRIELVDENVFRLIPPQSSGMTPLELDCSIANDESRAETIDLHGLKAKCVAFSEGESEWINAYLSSFTKRTVSGYRIVCISEGQVRKIHYNIVKLLTVDTKPYDGTLLADLCPMSLVSEASFRRLKQEIPDGGQGLDIDRFRSNIVVDGDDSFAFVEDHVAEFEIGDVRFRSIGPTFRCVIPSVDQSTAEAGFRKSVRKAEPIQTLKRLRSGGVRFGVTGFLPMTDGGSQSFAPLFGNYLGISGEKTEGKIKVGDPVRILKYRESPGIVKQYVVAALEYFGLDTTNPF